MDSRNYNIMDLNSWVARVFPITGADWKERVRLSAFLRMKLDEVQRRYAK